MTLTLQQTFVLLNLGTYKLTRHLLDLGDRRMAFAGDPAKASSARDRHRGFVAALNEAGLEEMISSVPRSDHVQYLRSLLQSPRPPTAIVARSDTKAAETLELAQELGLEVPGDLSVVGFDDVDRTLVQALSLTTARVDQAAMAAAAVDALLNRREGPQPPVRKHIPTELILRGSTGSPRRD